MTIAVAVVEGDEDGVGRQRSPALAARLGIAERVDFLGARDDIAAVLTAADAFALSSLVGGLPLALIEAMAAGLPIVATAVGGVPDAVGDAALLVPPRDPHAFGRALAALRADPERARELGARARRRAASRYSNIRMTDDYLRLYSRLR